jgi:hypothetical protein
VAFNSSTFSYRLTEPSILAAQVSVQAFLGCLEIYYGPLGIATAFSEGNAQNHGKKQVIRFAKLSGHLGDAMILTEHTLHRTMHNKMC